MSPIALIALLANLGVSNSPVPILKNTKPPVRKTVDGFGAPVFVGH